MSTSDFAVQTEQLTRVYGARRGIDDVSLAVRSGSLFGFLGPNGAGKTTTIRVLLGFLKPTSGHARVLGKDAWRDSRTIKADTGYVPGDLRLYPWMTGHSALSLFGSIRGRDMRAEGKRLADLFELDLNLKVRRMSRGTRQKLGLVLSMAHAPHLLILDEPTSGLDPLMQDRFRDLLRAQGRRGTTIFFSSHTLAEVESLCDRVAIVRQGRIIADATLDELRATARHEVQVTWDPAGNAIPEPPAFMTLTQISKTAWTGSIEDRSLGELLRFLAGRPVADVRIAKPDLETLFRRYYEVDTQAETEAGR